MRRGPVGAVASPWPVGRMSAADRRVVRGGGVCRRHRCVLVPLSGQAEKARAQSLKRGGGGHWSQQKNSVGGLASHNKAQSFKAQSFPQEKAQNKS